MAGQTGLHLSQEKQVEEYNLCCDGLAGFIYWCETYAKIEDKDSHRAITFRLYACQKRIIQKVFKGEWLRILKARRLGVTWLFAAYSVWLMSFREMQTVGYLIHKKEYSEDFVDRCDFIASRLPGWLRPTPTSQNKRELDYKDNESWIRALTATKGAADSVAADVVIVDEATKVEEKQAGLLGSILQSIEPTVETARGTIVLIAKSEGPQGLFYKGWMASEKGQDKYTNVFLSWRMRPGRSLEWYKNEVQMHAADPLFMPRNYPATADEAFQQAEGRVYPTFNMATHVGRILPDGTMANETNESLWVPDHWTKWRAVDWGGRDPFCTLWVARISKEGVRLTIDPACEKTIGEFMAYRYKPHTDYFEDKNNHCLPYETPVLTGHGCRPIGEIRVGDFVRTRSGLRRVLASGVTGIDQPLMEMETTSGRRLVATGNHPVLLADGSFRRMDGLASGDEVVACQSEWTAWLSKRMGARRSSFTKEQRSGGTRTPRTSMFVGTSGIADSAYCIEPSMRITSARSPRACTSTTLTKTRPTTNPRTFDWSVPSNTVLFIGHPNGRHVSESMSTRFGHWPRHGTAPKRGGRGIRSMPNAWVLEKALSEISSAIGAGKPSRAESVPVFGFAATSARRRPGWRVASTTLNVNVSSAERSSRSIGSGLLELVHDRVRTVRCTGRRATVYDLTVEGEHEFVASGIVVHNSMDSLRYLLETMSLTKGHYHVYRELYLPNTADDGLELPDLAAMVRDMTGDEQINMTVADRSQPLSINAFQLHRIPCMPNQHYLKEGASRRGLITQGVRMVNALLIGTGEFLPVRVKTELSPEDRVKKPPSGVSTGLEEAHLIRRKREKSEVSGRRVRHGRMKVTSRLRGRPI